MKGLLAAGWAKIPIAKLQVQYSGFYHSMGIYGADGLLLCNAVPCQGTFFSLDRLYLRLLMTTGKFAIGVLQIGRVTKQQAINAGYPITDSAGKVIAVAFVAIDLERLNRMAGATRNANASAVRSANGSMIVWSVRRTPSATLACTAPVASTVQIDDDPARP